MIAKLKQSGWLGVLLLLAVAVIIKVIAAFPLQVEEYYSSGLYPFIGASLRLLTGWMPFSLGDILYALAVIWMLYKLIKTIAAIVKRKITRQSFIHSMQKTIKLILGIYILFNLLWGLNYNRLGIAYQLQLRSQQVDTANLQPLIRYAIEKVNTARKNLGSDVTYPSKEKILRDVKTAYDSAKKKFSFLHYAHPHVKNSLYGRLGNYLGFLGYYNPFTGESQVNTATPPFVIPYTACHEAAHQLGYGSEDEANFAGYIAAIASGNKFFQYSAYFDLFNYANAQMFTIDSSLARNNYRQLDTLVKLDVIEYHNFILSHRNNIEPYISSLYGEYLKVNNQPQGLATYDDVVMWIIAYRKKYGEL